MTTTIALGLVNWFITLLLVESEIFRPIRDWVANQYFKREHVPGVAPIVIFDGWLTVLWYKAKYFVSCHLCTGTWVGVFLALITPWNTPLGSGVVGVVLAGLLYKAIGHLVLVVHRLGERWTQ